MRKIAILIGLESYRKLARNRVAEASTRTIASQLSRKYGFRTDEIVSVNYRDVYKNKKWDGNQLKTHLATLKLEGEYDLILVYFVGYGFVNPETQEKYLADNYTDSANLCQSGISLEWFKQWVDSLVATDKLVIIDANWTVARQNNTFESGYSCEPKEPVFPDRGTNTVYLFSCAEGEQSWRLPRSQQTVFTDYLLQALKRKLYSSDDLCEYVCWQTATAVQRELGKRQTPFSCRAGSSKILFTEYARQKRLKQRLHRIRSFGESFQTWLIGVSGLSIALFLAFAMFFPDQAWLYSRQLDEQFNQLVGEQMNQIGQKPVMIAQNNSEAVGTLVALPVDTQAETAATPPAEQTAGEPTAETAVTLPELETELEAELETDAAQTATTESESESESVSQEPIGQTNETGVSADSGETETTPQSSVPATTEESPRLENAPAPVSDPAKADNRPLTAGNEPVQTGVIPETIQRTIVVETTPSATLGPVITEPFGDNINKTAATTPIGRSSITGSTPQNAEPPKKARDDSQDFIWRDNPQDRAPTMPRNFPKINDYGLR